VHVITPPSLLLFAGKLAFILRFVGDLFALEVYYQSGDGGADDIKHREAEHYEQQRIDLEHIAGDDTEKQEHGDKTREKMQKYPQKKRYLFDFENIRGDGEQKRKSEYGKLYRKAQKLTLAAVFGSELEHRRDGELEYREIYAGVAQMRQQPFKEFHKNTPRS
jgi:hypothetical protein